jgi:putative ABC transport system permease protein
VAPRRLIWFVLGTFSVLAWVMAIVGTYGVIAYAVAQRTREIGIRMALGAQGGDVLRMIVRQGLILMLIGLGFGLLGALALTRLMSGVLYGVSATDAVTFVSVTALLFVVALIACWIPARRGAKVDPMVALRHE